MIHEVRRVGAPAPGAIVHRRAARGWRARLRRLVRFLRSGTEEAERRLAVALSRRLEAAR